MKKFLSILLALNFVLATVCYVTTSSAESSISGRQEICELLQGTRRDR